MQHVVYCYGCISVAGLVIYMLCPVWVQGEEECATDVSVPAGGTEQLHHEEFVGVVTKSIKNAPVSHRF